ncbi:putative DNA helicase [Vibrio chagasii]|nr:putative DNA helicase [Vibrio chagasii]
MSKINVSISDGQLIVKYRFNLYKNDKLKPLSLFLDKENSRYIGRRSQLPELLEIVKVEGLLINLSEDCQKYLGVNRDGYTAEEIKQEELKWADHPSYASTPPEGYDLSHLGLLREPFPFQTAGVYYGAEIAGGRCILGDQPGLGKTIQSILISAIFRNDWPIFIAAPASLLFNWKKEFLITLDWLSDDDIHIIDSAKNSKPRGLITIGSYYQLSANTDGIIDYLNTRGVLIIDEAHAIKNHESLRGEGALKIAHSAKRFMAITGTPMLNRTREIFPPLNGICPVVWGSFNDFTERYSEGHLQSIKGQSIYYADGASHLGELMGKLRDQYMVRRLKHVVLSQLPEKVRHCIYLNSTKNDKEMDSFIGMVSEKIIEIRESGVKDRAKIINNVIGFIADSPTGSILTQYEKAGLAKLPEIISYLQDKWDADPSNKFIVFVHNQSLVKAITEQFKKTQPRKEMIVIDGGVKPSKRFDYQEQFQNDENTTLALLTLGAASTGLTLTKSSNVVMAQLPWTPGIAMQAEDRAHRISQSEDVNIVYLLGNNGFDAYLWRMLESKSSVEQYALDGALGSSFEQTSDEMDEADVIQSICNEILDELEEFESEI